MAEVRGVVRVPPAAVWEVLADGWLYPLWVLGTSGMRAVDQDFPRVGSRIHHAVGLWPLVLNDASQVLECVPEQRLVLTARAWPAGEATTAVELSPGDGGTAVRLAETPTAGPGAWVNNPLAEALLARRLAEMLDRLRRLAEGRATDADPRGPARS